MTKDQRQLVLGEHYVAEAVKKAEEAEAAMEKWATPGCLHQGPRDRPWKKMDETTDSTESVANEAKATLFAAKAYATGKTTEVKGFDNRA